MFGHIRNINDNNINKGSHVQNDQGITSGITNQSFNDNAVVHVPPATNYNLARDDNNNINGDVDENKGGLNNNDNHNSNPSIDNNSYNNDINNNNNINNNPYMNTDCYGVIKEIKKDKTSNSYGMRGIGRGRGRNKYNYQRKYHPVTRAPGAGDDNDGGNFDTQIRRDTTTTTYHPTTHHPTTHHLTTHHHHYVKAPGGYNNNSSRGRGGRGGRGRDYRGGYGNNYAGRGLHRYPSPPRSLYFSGRGRRGDRGKGRSRDRGRSIGSNINTNHGYDLISSLQLTIKTLEDQNKELKDDLVKVTFAYNELNNNYKILQNRYDNITKTLSYDAWNYQNIVEWIITLEHGRFIQYKNDLLKYMKEEQIDGSCLGELTETDLYRFGVISFKDKKSLIKHIKVLINNENDLNDDNEGSVTAINDNDNW